MVGFAQVQRLGTWVTPHGNWVRAVLGISQGKWESDRGSAGPLAAELSSLGAEIRPRVSSPTGIASWYLPHVVIVGIRTRAWNPIPTDAADHSGRARAES